MRIISITNQKGGVGKTTTAINLAAGLSLKGKKVLLIDFDPQGNIGKTLFGISEIESGKTIYDLIDQELNNKSDINLNDVVRKYKNDQVNFDVLPSTITLAAAERKLHHAPVSPEGFLRRIVNKIKGYDFILIDCQPSLGQLVVNVMCCSNINELIIPVEADSFSMQGINGLFETLNEIKNGTGISPLSYRFLITNYDSRRIEDKFQKRAIEEKFIDHVFKTQIRQCTALKTSHSYGNTIFNQSPDSNAAIDYMNLTKEILNER